MTGVQTCALPILHDPTTLNRQGNDTGPQYRSAIYAEHEDELGAARAYVQKLEENRIFKSPIVTELAPLQSYWPAEAYHQDYFEQHPNQGYCAFVVAPKVAKFEHHFTRHLKPST